MAAQRYKLPDLPVSPFTHHFHHVIRWEFTYNKQKLLIYHFGAGKNDDTEIRVQELFRCECLRDC
jgi:hypothetical protein